MASHLSMRVREAGAVGGGEDAGGVAEVGMVSINNFLLEKVIFLVFSVCFLVSTFFR